MSPEQIDYAEFDLHCNGDYAATATGPRADAWREIQHYAAVYAPDGPTEIFEVTRTPVNFLASSSSRSEEVARLREALEACQVDAERYRWLKAQKSLLLESATGFWTKADGSRFSPTHRLCAGDTQFAAYETLDEAIDAARSALKENK